MKFLIAMATSVRSPQWQKPNSNSATTHNSSYLSFSMIRIRSRLNASHRRKISGASIWKWNLTALTGKCAKGGSNNVKCCPSPPKSPCKPLSSLKTKTTYPPQTLNPKPKEVNPCLSQRRQTTKSLHLVPQWSATRLRYTIGKPFMNKFWKHSQLTMPATITWIGVSSRWT